jgi:hypothetical protein
MGVDWPAPALDRAAALCTGGIFSVSGARLKGLEGCFFPLRRVVAGVRTMAAMAPSLLDVVQFTLHEVRKSRSFPTRELHRWTEGLESFPTLCGRPRSSNGSSYSVVRSGQS